MSVDKFKFASPGIQTTEIDESRLEQQAVGVGPVVIGRTAKGPAMRPITVSTVAELERVFGAPYSSKSSATDVWRDGNELAPTYATYAAKAFLQNSAPVTVIRLLGEQHDDATSDGKAGWSFQGTGDAYGIYLFKDGVVNEVDGKLAGVVYSKTGYEPKLSITTPLVPEVTQIIPQITSSLNSAYLTASALGSLTTSYVLSGAFAGIFALTTILGITSASNLGPWYLQMNASATLTNSASDIKFKKLEVPASTTYNTLVQKNGETLDVYFGSSHVKKVFSFKKDQADFIRNILNCNPVKTNTSLYSSEATQEYFLGETFEDSAVELCTGNYYAAICKLPTAATVAQKPNSSAESGWVVSQDMSTDNANFSIESVSKLFKFITLNGGEQDQMDYFISIENIKVSPYPNVNPYGTFDVAIRDMNSQEVLERYSDLNLNQDSSNYIARVIGDTYFYWSYSEERYKEIGNYPNRSARVRVEMFSTDPIDPPELLPFGFLGPKAPAGVTLNTSTGSFANSLLSVGNTGKTKANVAYPTLPLLAKNAKALSRTRWGLKLEKGSNSLNDLLAINALTKLTPEEDTSGVETFFFTLDDVAPIVNSSGAEYASGKRKTGTSYSSVTGATYKDTLVKCNAFQMPLFGGFNGLNIFLKECFINDQVLTEDVNARNSTAYNTVEIALKSISDKEVIETDIICVPGLTNNNLQQELIDICEQRGDAIALVDIEEDYKSEFVSYKADKKDYLPDVKLAIETFKDRDLDTTYAAAYFPAVYSSIDQIFLPASLAALGVLGGTEGNSALWFAPAGFVRGGISPATAGLSVSRAAQHLTSKERDELYNANINPLATFPNEGVVVFGQKTLQAQPSALSRVNVRRLLNYIKRNVGVAAKGVLFEPNVQATWNNFKSRVNPFLTLVKSNFGLEDFRVILDGRTTTADLIDRNTMYAKILLKPTRTIEYIAVDFVITNTGAVFTE